MLIVDLWSNSIDLCWSSVLPGWTYHVHIQEFVAFLQQNPYLVRWLLWHHVINYDKSAQTCVKTATWQVCNKQPQGCNFSLSYFIYHFLHISYISFSPSLCRAFCSWIALVSGGSTGSGFVLRAPLFLQPKDSNHPALWRTAQFKKKWMVLSCRSPAGTLNSVDAFSFTSVNLSELMNWRMWACSYIFQALLSKWVTAQKWKTNQFH